MMVVVRSPGDKPKPVPHVILHTIDIARTHLENDERDLSP